MATGTSSPQPQRQNRSFALIAAIGMALAALIILNVAQNRLDPKVQQRLAEEAQMKAMEEAQKKAEAGGGGGQPAAVAVGGRANQLPVMGTNVVIGPAQASNEITVAYEWTPTVQGNPASIAAIVDALTKQFPGAKVRLVNLDAEPNYTPGVSVNGQVITGPEPDGTLDIGRVMRGLQTVPKLSSTPPSGPPMGGPGQPSPPPGPPPTAQ